MTVIALDAMGGDFAPRIPVEAAVRAVRESACEVVLVGDQPRLEKELARHKLPGKGLRIHHTPEWIEMGESPAEALRRKKQASVQVAMEMVSAGEASAAVSAGNSGAMMIAGKLAMDTIPGVDRPAIATPIPHRRGISLLLDSGANVDCRPEHLVQFARMGSQYASRILGVPDPRVGLLNNGEEPGRGNEVARQAYALLQAQVPGFVGNIEGRDLFRGRADVIVCDGFVGNLVLKTAEAAGRQLRLLLRESLTRSPRALLGYWLLRPLLARLLVRLDYQEIGGMPLLGLQGVALVCHGASNAASLANGMLMAVRAVDADLAGALTEEFTGAADSAAPAGSTAAEGGG